MSVQPLSAYVGLSPHDGRAIAGDTHLRASIRDILLTPVGSRVMRRDYGSRLAELIDAPATLARVADLVAATAEAILRWEPRVTLHRVLVRSPQPGAVAMDLELTSAGRTLRLDDVL